MKFLAIFLACLLPIVFSAPSNDMDPIDDLDEDQFRQYFHLRNITDPKEHKKRAEALKKNEKAIKRWNKKYLKGKITWHAAINEFSDLPEDEFEKKKAGALTPENITSFGFGNLEPTGAERVDEESERYFDQIRESIKLNRAIPDSYSAVDEGLVSAVKNQKQCGSCVAFSNMALIETCFRRVTGAFSDFSEQHLVDCGFGENGANGCDGAWTHAYAKWVADNQPELLAEATYPYLNEEPNLSCPKDLPSYDRGAKVTQAAYTYRGSEDLLKSVVFKHGAAVASVSAYGPMQDYDGGIFSGCTNTTTDHAVTVVGYGSDPESGKDYWLIKNSWGKAWGEEGYIRMERGVGMCGIGKTIVIVGCEKVAGPTDATLVTEAPCDDVYTNCAEMAETSCYDDHISSSCPNSCGLCPGMTPVASNTCFDKYGNCPEEAATNCWHPDINTNCKKSCGLCQGMTPVSSNTCYDKYTNCADACRTLANTDCRKSCGKC